tara:strand:- start:627 stop:1217 length:591 start_codon:yes stop_codon:yes gene_type:complete
MISFRELKHTILGIFFLVRFNPQGLDYFENNLTAFWRSYWAAIFSFPLYIGIIILQTPNFIPLVGPLDTAIIYITGYLLGWFSMPFVMFYVCRGINREENFYQYFIIYNWATLFQITFMAAITICTKLNIFHSDIAGFSIFLAISMILIYQAYIAHLALEISRLVALAIVILDLTIGLLIEGWATKLLLGQGVFSG